MLELIYDVQPFLFFAITNNLTIDNIINIYQSNKYWNDLLKKFIFPHCQFIVQTDENTKNNEYLFMLKKQIKFTKLIIDDKLQNLRRKIGSLCSEYNYGREPKFIRKHALSYKLNNENKFLTYGTVVCEDEFTTELSINSFDSNFKFAFTNVQLFTIANKDIHLKKISINCSRNRYITNEGIIKIAEKCLQLTHFHINCSFNTFISDLAIITLVNNCKQLQFLSINCYKQSHITNESLKEIAKCCNNLINFELYCSANPYIGQNSIISVCDKCKNLKTFTFYGSVLVNSIDKSGLSNLFPHIKFIF